MGTSVPLTRAGASTWQTIPARSLTDFSWFASTNPGAACFFQVGNFTSSGLGASDGYATKSEHFTTGIPLTVNPNRSTPIFAGQSPCNFLGSTITGYLTPNQ